MGTKTQSELADRIHQARWAQQRAADAVCDGQARVIAIERALDEARRQLQAAELELQAATLAVHAAEGDWP